MSATTQQTLGAIIQETSHTTMRRDTMIIQRQIFIDYVRL